MQKLPSRLSGFTGRKVQLEELARVFQNNRHALLKHSSKITGTGGIGKTQIAVEFCHQMLGLQKFSQIIWLNADTTIHDALAIEMVQLARSMDIDPNHLDSAMLTQRVFSELNELGGVLIVYDDAHSYSEIKDYLPKPEYSHICTLITSRDNCDWGETFNTITVDLFSLQEACEYLRKVLLIELQGSEQERANLAELLNCFPLALAQAAGFIRTRNIAIAEYCRLFEEKQSTAKQLLNRPTLAQDPHHQQTIWVTIQLCQENLANKSAIKLLQHVAYLAPESAIDELLLHYLVNDQNTVEDAIKMLRSFSLLEPVGGNNELRIHKIVQDILRAEHPINQFEQYLLVDSECVFAYSQESDRILEDEMKDKKLLTHLRTVLRHFESVENPSVEVLLARAKCDRALANIFFHLLLDYQSAKIHFVRAKTTFDQYGTLIQKLYLDRDLAIMHSVLGNPQQALIQLTKLLELVDQLTESQQFTTVKLALLNDLACTHSELGNHKQQLAYLEFAKELVEQHINNIYSAEFVMTTMNLINALRDNHKAKQSLTIAYQLLPIIVDATNENHPSVARLKTNMAHAYLVLGEINSAEKLYEQVIDIHEKTYGPNHWQYAKSLCNLALCYIKNNKEQLALNRLSCAYQIQLQVFGANHFETLSTQLTIAEHSSSIQKIPVFLKILDGYQHSLHPNHPNCLDIHDKLIDCYLKRNEPHLASIYLELLGKKIVSIYGESHNRFAKYLVTVGLFWLCVNNIRNAIGSFLSAITLLKQEQKSDIESLVIAYLNLSTCYPGIANNLLAYPYLVQTQLYLTQSENSLRMMHIADKLAKNYISRGFYQECVEVLTHCATFYRRTFGEQHPPYRSAVEGIKICQKHINLFKALRANNFEQIQQNMTSPKEIFLCDSEGVTPLEHAIHYCSREICEWLLDFTVVYYSIEKHKEITIFDLSVIATIENDLAVLRLLIHLQEPLDVQEFDSGKTALHYACEQNNIEAATLLVEGGAKVSIKDKDGNSAVDLAHNNEKLIEILKRAADYEDRWCLVM